MGRTAIILWILFVCFAGSTSAQAQTYTNGDIVGGGSGVTFPKYNTVWVSSRGGLYAPAPGNYCYSSGSLGSIYPAEIHCDDAGDGYAGYRFTVPRDYKLGTDIDVHLYWARYNVLSGTNIVWVFGYRLTEIENATGALTTDSNTVAVGGENVLMITKLHTFAGPTTLTQTLSGEIMRDGNDAADDYIYSGQILGLLFVYESDSVSSAGIMTK